MCTIPECQLDMATKRCSSCCNTTATDLLRPGMTLKKSRIKTVDLLAQRRPRYAHLKSYIAIGPLWPYLFESLDFSVVFQWRGHDLISNLRSSNKKIIDMHIFKVHGLTTHAKFRNRRSKAIGHCEGQILTCITSIHLQFWWPELT